MRDVDIQKSLEQQVNVVEELSKSLLDKSWALAGADSHAEVAYELAALAGGINSSAEKLRDVNIQKSLEQQGNVVEQLSKSLLDKSWALAGAGIHGQIAYELAALAGGINSSAEKIMGLVSRLGRAGQADAGEVEPFVRH